MSSSPSDYSSSSSESEDERRIKRQSKRHRITIPKRPPNGYNRYCKTRFAEIKAKDPEAKYINLSPKFSEEWKNMREDEKEPFNAAYEKEFKEWKNLYGEEARRRLRKKKRARERKKMKEQASASDEDGEPKKRKRRKKDPNAPKAPISSFLRWNNEVRDRLQQENPEKTFGELAKLAGALWHQMTEDQKEKYKKSYALDRIAYAKSKAQYDEEQRARRRRRRKRREKRKKRRRRSHKHRSDSDSD